MFVDSSLISYAAVPYLNNQLFFTKTRLAPDRTIHELELMATTLGVKVGDFLYSILKSATQEIEIFYWKDSQVCIAWSKSQKPLKPFMKNMVNFVQNKKVTFCYIPPISILQILQQRQIRDWLLIASFGGLAQIYLYFNLYQQLRLTLVQQNYLV